jgi:PAS domain S-box-containing protein
MEERVPLVLPDLSHLPAAAAAEREMLENREVCSVIAFPLRLQGRSAGFLGLESVAAPRDWAAEETELVENLADFFSNALARWEAEQALEVSRERLRRGQIFANIGTWDWSPSGDLYWSERIPALFGYAEGTLETSFESFLQAVHPDDRAMITAAIEASLERDAPYEVEHRVVWPDGTVRWLLERGAVIRDESGQPVQMLGVVQDVDDRKRAELALAERERQLREAQALARVGSWRADLSTGELTWSDEIYRIFGHEPGGIRPDLETFYAHVHPDDLAAVRESVRTAGASGRQDLIHRIVRPDGSVRHVHELAQAETDAGGRLVGLVGAVQDVTERVEAERALIAARDEAERADRAKSDFLSAMSHELRTPMNAILGFGQLMEYDASLPEEHRDSVHEILKAGRHLLDLINEVLDLSKVESGRVELSMEPVDVDAVIEECLSLVASLAEQSAVTLVHTPSDGRAVRADRTRLKQALLNLLSNAIKYNREGGEVALETRPVAGDRLQIRVRDTGPGIPAERLAELFLPFNRLGAENSEIEGTGIGLTLTRRIMEMMGGTVDVESEPGTGSTFWVELPLDEIAAETDARRDDVAPIAARRTGRAQATRTVLYVEDNPANLKLVAQILGRRRHLHLLTAHTPGLGIELARARRPDLILLDINLPGMDGYQVLGVLRADAHLRDVPVVAVTANAMPRDIARGRAAGFVEYLTKPLDVAAFEQLMDRLLGQSP